MYAEFGDDSDIYVKMSGERLECVGCVILGKSFYAYSTDGMSLHLEDHKLNYDKVPDYLEDSLWSDDEINFPYE